MFPLLRSKRINVTYFRLATAFVFPFLFVSNRATGQRPTPDIPYVENGHKCRILDTYTPEGLAGTRLPVMFSIHGQRRSDAAALQQNTDTGKLVHGLLGWDKGVPESMAMHQAGRNPGEARMWMIAWFCRRHPALVAPRRRLSRGPAHVPHRRAADALVQGPRSVLGKSLAAGGGRPRLLAAKHRLLRARPRGGVGGDALPLLYAGLSAGPHSLYSGPRGPRRARRWQAGLEPLRTEPSATVVLTFVPEFPIYPPETGWMRHPKTDTPGLVLKGRVAYLAADLDRRFARDNLPDHGDLLANLVRWAAGGGIPLAVEGGGLVDFNLYTQPGRLVLHAVNLASAATWREPIHELIAIGPLVVKVRLPAGVRGRRARLLVTGGTAAPKLASGWASFEIQPVLDHEVVLQAYSSLRG